MGSKVHKYQRILLKICLSHNPIHLVFNIEVFQIKFFLNKIPQKKKKKSSGEYKKGIANIISVYNLYKLFVLFDYTNYYLYIIYTNLCADNRVLTNFFFSYFIFIL